MSHPYRDPGHIENYPSPHYFNSVQYINLNEIVDMYMDSDGYWIFFFRASDLPHKLQPEHGANIFNALKAYRVRII